MLNFQFLIKITSIIIIIFQFSFSALADDFQAVDQSQIESFSTSKKTENTDSEKGFISVENQEENISESFQNEDNPEQNLLNSLIQDIKNHLFWFSLILFAFSIATYIKKSQKLRIIIMLVSVSILGFYLGGCLCPIGLPFKAAAGVPAQQIPFTIILLLFTVGTTLMGGRFFCSSVCPFGALQEILNFKDHRIDIPYKIEKILRIFRLLLLIIFIIISFILSSNIFDEICPVKAVFNLNGTLIQLILGGIILLISLFIYRPFCRIVCPLGAILDIAGRFSFYRLHIDPQQCCSCEVCHKKCPVNAVREDLSIDQGACIRCGECRTNCPKDCL